MGRVVYAPVANDDLIEIAAFIARDKPATARQWVQEIRKTGSTLSTQPEMGEEREGFGVPGCRSFSVGSYVVFFRPISDGIEVARIIHGSRDMQNL
jgi:toxin ParE1/3/4